MCIACFPLVSTLRLKNIQSLNRDGLCPIYSEQKYLECKVGSVEMAIVQWRAANGQEILKTLLEWRIETYTNTSGITIVVVDFTISWIPASYY